MKNQSNDEDEWGNFKDKNFQKPEGFGIIPSGPAPRHPSQAGPEYAAARHREFLRGIDALDLMTLPWQGKKDSQILRYLYRNSEATMKSLRDHLRDWDLTPGAIGRAIRRINDLFIAHQIPLYIDKKRGSTGFERVWLEIRI